MIYLNQILAVFGVCVVVLGEGSGLQDISDGSKAFAGFMSHSAINIKSYLEILSV